MATDSVDLPQWLRSLIAAAFLLVFIPFAIYGFTRQLYTGTAISAEIEEDVVTPYFTALQAQDWSAMHALRTPAAQAGITTDDLQAGYAETIAPLGSPQALNLQIAKERHNTELGQHYYVTLMYTGSDGQSVLGFVVQRTSGPESPFAIAQTLRHSGPDLWVQTPF